MKGFNLQISGYETKAEFSPCKKYRYRLWRKWSDNPRVCFVMLNPSTADDINNDPTVERCQRRAKAWGFGAVEVVNIFALRSTNPKVLYNKDVDPIGDWNNKAIKIASMQAQLIVCGWGKHGSLMNRGSAVVKLLSEFKLYYLRTNSDGSPEHPLYIPYSVKPQEWKWTNQ